MRKQIALYAVAAAAFLVFAVHVQHAEAGAWKRHTDKEAWEYKDKLTGEIKKYEAEYSVRASSLDGGLEVQVNCKGNYGSPPTIWFNSKVRNFVVYVDYSWEAEMYKRRQSIRVLFVPAKKAEYHSISSFSFKKNDPAFSLRVKNNPASFLRKMRKARSMKIEYNLVREPTRIAEISLMGLNKALAECPK